MLFLNEGIDCFFTWRGAAKDTILAAQAFSTGISIFIKKIQKKHFLQST